MKEVKKDKKKSKKVAEVKDELNEEITEVEEVNEGDLKNFPLSAAIRKKLEARGVKALFPIQSKTFHQIFAGQDIIAQASNTSHLLTATTA